jgi:hypothetical protein
MSALSAKHHPGVLAEFLDLLKNRWTFQVACQNECRPVDACSCMRHIIHVEAVKEWWTSTTPDSATQTRLERLLENSELFEPRPSVVEKIWPSKDRSYILILSMLLEQGHSQLLGRFVDSDMDLRENLARSISKIEVHRIMDEFMRERWAYCPLILALNMDRTLQGSRIIPPFCHKIQLGSGGGTASIYWIAVQRDLITDDALAFALRDSLYTDTDIGEVSFSARPMAEEANKSRVLSDGPEILWWRKATRL